MKSNSRHDTTIAAIATPPGKGGVGIIRLSGPAALQTGLSVFRFGNELKIRKRIDSHHMYFGWAIKMQNVKCKINNKNDKTKINDSASRLRLDHVGQTVRSTAAGRQCAVEEKIDNGFLVYFKAPDSYTGEDVVELQMHGSPKSLQTILELCLYILPSDQVRPAEPGEFTKRAFLNGKLDLSQAEAVADLIEAKTQAAGRLAGRQLGGDFAKVIKAVRLDLLELLSQIQGNLNFPEDDVPETSKKYISKTTEQSIAELEDLIARSRHGWLYREGLHVAIVGSPNVGKSSLFNALLAHDRALVSEISGTTRDTIEETLDIRGIPVILTDTAGITKSEDRLEQMSIERSEQAIEHADLILLVLDASQTNSTADSFLHTVKPEIKSCLLSKPMIIAYNKKDKLTKPFSRLPRKSIRTSMHLPKTIEQLKELLIHDYLSDSLEHSDPILANSRQSNLLEQARQALLDCQTAQTQGFDVDTVSIDIESAISNLSQILGIEADEQTIDRIFERFCIGK